jgi:hypothetical protein
MASSSTKSSNPFRAQTFRLLQNRSNRFLLLIWRVFIFPQNPLHHQSQFGPVFALIEY